jgi:hypothetical protein
LLLPKDVMGGEKGAKTGVLRPGSVSVSPTGAMGASVARRSSVALPRPAMGACVSSTGVLKPVYGSVVPAGMLGASTGALGAATGVLRPLLVCGLLT